MIQFKRNGVAATEFAIAIPIFLAIILGVIEIGRAVMVRQVMMDAARLGAREAIVPDATVSDVVSQVNNLLDSQGVKAPNKTVQILDGDGVVITDLKARNSKDWLEVRVSVPANEVGWGTSFISGTFTTSSTMRKE